MHRAPVWGRCPGGRDWQVWTHEGEKGTKREGRTSVCPTEGDGTVDKQASPLRPQGPVNRSLGDITTPRPLRIQNSVHPAPPISACRPHPGGPASFTGPRPLLHWSRHLPLQKPWAGCRPAPCLSPHRPGHRAPFWGGFKRHVSEAASSEKGKAGEQAEGPAHGSGRGP